MREDTELLLQSYISPFGDVDDKNGKIARKYQAKYYSNGKETSVWMALNSKYGKC